MVLLAYWLIKLLCCQEFFMCFLNFQLLNSFSVLVIRTTHLCQVKKVPFSTAWLEAVTNCRTNLLSHKAHWDLSTHCYWDQYGETKVNNASSTQMLGPTNKLWSAFFPRYHRGLIHVFQHFLFTTLCKNLQYFIYRRWKASVDFFS